MYRLNRDDIWEKYGLIKDGFKLNSGIKIQIPPFKTQNISSDIKKISLIISDLLSEIYGEINTNAIEMNQIMNSIENLVETDSMDELKEMLRSIYFKDGELVKFHPRIYLYNTEAKNTIKDYVNYLYRNLYTLELKNIVQPIFEITPDIITDKIILNALPGTTNKKVVHTVSHTLILQDIKSVFEQDFKFLCKNKNLFLVGIEFVIKYYLFFLTSQLILSLKSGIDEDSVGISPVFYFVDWEQISKTRDGYKQGWKMLDAKSKDIFAFINAIEVLNTTNDENFSGDFREIAFQVENMEENDKNEFKEIVFEFISNVRNHLDLDIQPKDHIKGFNTKPLIRDLINTFIDVKEANSGSRKAAFERYESGLLEIAKLGFLKAKGNLGLTLSFNEEWITFLTRLCINQQTKIRLNDLWTQMERRGIFFDRYSKEKIVAYFEKINILEKKSDSGDAQYVRFLQIY